MVSFAAFMATMDVVTRPEEEYQERLKDEAESDLLYIFRAKYGEDNRKEFEKARNRALHSLGTQNVLSVFFLILALFGLIRAVWQHFE